MKAFAIAVFLLITPFSKAQNLSKANETVGITFSLPWVNYYKYIDYDTKQEHAKKFGFFGLGLAVYYKKNEHQISFNCSATEDLASPIGQLDYSKQGIQKSIGSSFFELVYKHPIYKNINAVIGLNLTNYDFRLISYEKDIKSFIKRDQTLGTSIGLVYSFDNYFSAATMYRPALASFEADDIYRHLISIELLINLSIWKKKY
jgi:hypothetical protein